MKSPLKNRILLIEDDEMMRIYFRDIFWIHGRSDIYEVVLASNYEQALSFIEDKELRPNTIFLDVTIPEKGKDNSLEEQIKRSLSFVEKIKSTKKYSDIKVVIYSSYNDNSLEKEFKEKGIDGYLIKGQMMPREIIAFTDKIYGSDN